MCAVGIVHRAERNGDCGFVQAPPCMSRCRTGMAVVIARAHGECRGGGESVVKAAGFYFIFLSDSTSLIVVCVPRPDQNPTPKTRRSLKPSIPYRADWKTCQHPTYHLHPNYKRISSIDVFLRKVWNNNQDFCQPLKPTYESL